MIDTENIRIKRNLAGLVEFSRIINSSLDLTFILNNLLFSCLGKFHTTRGIIAVNENGKLTVKNYKGFTENIIKAFPELKADNDLYNVDELKVFLEEKRIKVCEELKTSNDFLGILLLGERLSNEEYSDDDIEYLRAILNISSTAVKNALMMNQISVINKSLDEKVNRLNSLFELSKEFGLLAETERVGKLLTYSVIGEFLVSKYSVVTLDENNKCRILETTFPPNKLEEALASCNITEIVTPVNSSALRAENPQLFDIGVELIVPMQLRGNTRGLILLGKRINNQLFSENDIEFIYSAGSLGIISIENKRLFLEALEKQKLEEELQIAREIQKNLFPHEIPQFKNFEIAAQNISSKQVGGDYFDIIKTNETEFYAAIGDVSGKGVPAALLMANLQAFLKSLCRQSQKISEATNTLNDLVSENTSDGKFITYFWGLFDDTNKKITYVNAGHNPPLLIREGKLTKLEKGGMILGVMKTITPYQSDTIKMQSGDLLIMFTDGVTEAMNSNNEEFSDERLEEIVLKNSAGSSSEILKIILDEVKVFTKNTPQSDDITLVVIKAK